MLMAMRRTFILGATAFALLAGACGSSDTQTPAPVPTTVAPTGGMMGGGGAGIANPASEFCVAQGGTVELETDANGGGEATHAAHGPVSPASPHVGHPGS